MMKPETSIVLVLAGRRIDEPGAEPARFPLGQAQAVAQVLRAVFRKEHVGLIVSSAACGADLIALSVAQTLDIRFRIILPFSPLRFRETSVIDRPSGKDWEWGRVYDEVIEAARARQDLIILPGLSEGLPAYQAVNRALVAEAMTLGRCVGEADPGNLSDTVKALIIWDGRSRSSKDVTWHFAEVARSHALPVLEIRTTSCA
jgi:hypothetical protein